MKTEFCLGDCNQDHDCPISERTVRAHIISYIICSIAAVALVFLIGAAQTMDSADEQVIATQVKACSEFPIECREFAEIHATANQDRRQ